MRPTRKRPGSSCCAATVLRSSISRRPTADSFEEKSIRQVNPVEPSRQAAFVDYAATVTDSSPFRNPPDYYQIPFADRQALLQEQARDDFEQAEREEAKTSETPRSGGDEEAARSRRRSLLRSRR